MCNWIQTRIHNTVPPLEQGEESQAKTDMEKKHEKAIQKQKIRTKINRN